jgi:hypothetical protein
MTVAGRAPAMSVTSRAAASLWLTLGNYITETLNLEAVSLENSEVEVKTAFLVYRSHWRRIITSSPAAARMCFAR